MKVYRWFKRIILTNLDISINIRVIDNSLMALANGESLLKTECFLNSDQTTIFHYVYILTFHIDNL